MSELILAAPLRLEAALIASAVRGAPVHKTGMGPARARAAAGELGGQRRASGARRSASAAGSTSPRCPGEVIVAEEVYAAPDENHREQPVRCDLAGRLVGRLTGLGLKVRLGNVVCVSKLALGERRAELHAGGAIAVDMESVWLAAGAAGAAVRRRARGPRQPQPRAAPPAGGRRGAARRARAAQGRCRAS